MDINTFDTRPRALSIKKIIKENDYTNTYVFEYPLNSRPGQFVMLWIPGVDEKPFSIAYDDGAEFWLTICNVGPATNELFKLKEGSKVGVRGPFGTDYKFNDNEKIAVVAGGYGAAPMYFTAMKAQEKNCEIDFLIGARSKNQLLFTEKIAGLESVNLHIATDDGSIGKKGFVTLLLADLLQEKKFDRVFTCGPEVMMKKVGEISHETGIKCFMSVERYMKCGFGVCGQCVIDDSGVCVCKKGPVMDFEYVKTLPEFGSYHRDQNGKKHFFNQ